MSNITEAGWTKPLYVIARNIKGTKFYARLQKKTEIESKLDRELLECIGFFEKVDEREPSPNVAKIISLLKQGARLDHLVPTENLDVKSQNTNYHHTHAICGFRLAIKQGNEPVLDAIVDHYQFWDVDTCPEPATALYMQETVSNEIFRSFKF